MGLTVQSVGAKISEINIQEKIPKGAKTVALAGNPNVGKSTLFNKITGLKQHTGNWPGKTVTNAIGEYKDKQNHLAFPMLIAIITMFFINSGDGGLLSALILTAVILFGIGTTFLVSKILAKTILKGEPSSFTLELPPYRKPQIGSVIIRSIFDRTVFVLLRAMSVAAPAGLIIWILANFEINNVALLSYISDFLDPFGKIIGLDGVILLGFILGFPANEIVIPIIIMVYMGNGTLTDYGSLFELKALLVDNGWTVTTAICTIVFSLMHWPCSTTVLTAKKETGSLYWSFITFITPTVCGILFCFVIAFISGLF